MNAPTMRDPVPVAKRPPPRRHRPTPAFQTSRLTKTYGSKKAAVHALQGIDLTIERGTFTSIMGPSGSGKSTLLHLLGLLDAPSSGTIRSFGRDVGRLPQDARSLTRRRTIGFVFQAFHLLPNLNAGENVALPMRFAGIPRRERRKRGHSLLAQVGLEDRAGHKPSELSGGEKQRVAVARALALDPGVILADEPTGNLDTRTGQEILGLLKELRSQGRTVVQVTHDVRMTRHSDRVVHMEDGRIVPEKTPDGPPDTEAQPLVSPRATHAGGTAGRSRR